MRLIVEQIKVPVNTKETEVFEIARARLKKTRAFSLLKDFYVYKKSVDARNKSDIKLVYSVCVLTEPTGVLTEKFLSKNQLKVLPNDNIDFVMQGAVPDKKPLIVGFGPAGMFCAIALARAGLKPVVIERGADVDTRVEVVANFYKNKKLDINTNIQFGAGGAGTFSDGKLNTGINDPKCAFVLKSLYEFGGPKDILYSAKPHIGTDILREVVKNIAKHIVELGGEIHYNTRLDSFSNGIAKTNNGDFEYSSLVLAIGHSARDTYHYLLNNGAPIEPKPFSVGVRVEHLQKDINYAMYGELANTADLGAASYNISHRENNRGVYSFCMCPGGEVVAGQSEENTVVVNGMSFHARNGVNSNSAIVVQINREDYGSTPIQAIEYQRNLEKKAFVEAGGNYKAPSQTLGDFFEDKAINSPTKISPTYMNGNVSICNLNKILPKTVSDYLKLGFRQFGKKIKGFDNEDVILTGVETRTSAPIRILRTEKYNMLGQPCVYPCGEGAGYAGGIMSAAVDGLNVGLAILNNLKD